MAMWLRHDNAASSITPTLTAINNLAVNEQNNKEMEVCLFCFSISILMGKSVHEFIICT